VPGSRAGRAVRYRVAGSVLAREGGQVRLEDGVRQAVSSAPGGADHVARSRAAPSGVVTMSLAPIRGTALGTALPLMELGGDDARAQDLRSGLWCPPVRR
jgi:hypothetical protein